MLGCDNNKEENSLDEDEDEIKDARYVLLRLFLFFFFEKCLTAC